MLSNALPVYRLLKALIISVSIVMTSFYVGLNLRLMCQPETAPCQPSCYSGGQLVYLAVNLVPDWEQTHGVVFRVVPSQCWVRIKKNKKRSLETSTRLIRFALCVERQQVLGFHFCLVVMGLIVHGITQKLFYYAFFFFFYLTGVKYSMSRNFLLNYLF